MPDEGPLSLGQVAQAMLSTRDPLLYPLGEQLIDMSWRHSGPTCGPCWECARGTCGYAEMSTPASLTWLTELVS